jgi:hypothetical protein
MSERSIEYTEEDLDKTEHPAGIMQAQPSRRNVLQISGRAAWLAVIPGTPVRAGLARRRETRRHDANAIDD